jgi:hypothetical protein
MSADPQKGAEAINDINRRRGYIRMDKGSPIVRRKEDASGRQLYILPIRLHNHVSFAVSSMIRPTSKFNTQIAADAKFGHPKLVSKDR